MLFAVSAVVEMNGHSLYATFIRPELPERIIATQYDLDGSVATEGTVPDDITEVLSPGASFLHDMMNLSSMLVGVLPVLSVPLLLALMAVRRTRPFGRYVSVIGIHSVLVVIMWFWADSVL